MSPSPKGQGSLLSDLVHHCWQPTLDIHLLVYWCQAYEGGHAVSNGEKGKQTLGLSARDSKEKQETVMCTQRSTHEPTERWKAWAHTGRESCARVTAEQGVHRVNMMWASWEGEDKGSIRINKHGESTMSKTGCLLEHGTTVGRRRRRWEHTSECHALKITFTVWTADSH